MTMGKPPPPCETELVRFAWLTMPKAPEFYKPYDLMYGDAGVKQFHTRTNKDGGVSFLVGAHVELTYFPNVSPDGRVRVPSRERRHLEFGIELVANLRAVYEKIPCRITSPDNCVFFLPNSDRARDWFNSFTEIHREVEQSGRLLGNWTPIAFDELELNELRDRFDGLALLAEVVYTSHPMGVYRDLVRLFEAAFARPPWELAPLVLSTLEPRLCYTLAEVKPWFDSRNPSSHADRSDAIFLSSDVDPFIGRMRQAAYDIFLNKKEWRSDATDRREFWPLRAATGAGNDLILTQGRSMHAEVRVFDPFGVYPMDLTSSNAFEIEGAWPPVRHTNVPNDVTPDSGETRDNS